MGLAVSRLATPSTAKAATSKQTGAKPCTYSKGKVTIEDEEDDDDATKAVVGNYKSIFVLARPKNPASIPPQVVGSARGGVPAVFFAVVPHPTFPAEFTSMENDITPKGDFELSSVGSVLVERRRGGMGN